MKTSSILMFEVERNERRYSLAVPAGAPFGEAYDVTFEMLRKIVEMSNQAVEAAKPQDTSAAPQPADT